MAGWYWRRAAAVRDLPGVAEHRRGPERLAIASIADGAMQRRCSARSLSPSPAPARPPIAERLPMSRAKPLVFPQPAPRAPLGSWMLLDGDTILAAADRSSPFPNGEARFVEDRQGPPYWRLHPLSSAGARTRSHRRPAPGELCLDLGASPGGPAWVLAELGARVIAVDKAPHLAVAALPGVESRRASAFALEPAEDRAGGLALQRCHLLSRAAAGPGLSVACRGWRATSSANAPNSRARRIWPQHSASPRSRRTLPPSPPEKHELTWIKLGESGFR